MFWGVMPKLCQPELLLEISEHLFESLSGVTTGNFYPWGCGTGQGPSHTPAQLYPRSVNALSLSKRLEPLVTLFFDKKSP